MSAKTTYICDVTGLAGEEIAEEERPGEAPDDFAAPLGWGEITIRYVAPNPAWPQIEAARTSYFEDAVKRREAAEPNAPALTETEIAQIEDLIATNLPGERTVYVERTFHASPNHLTKLLQRFGVSVSVDKVGG